MATIPELLAAAINHHRAGSLREAAQLYEQILSANPRHADALHLLGVVAHQSGHQQQAIQSISGAIQADSRQASFHNSLGEAYRALGQTEDAKACYRRSLELDSRYGPAHHNLGLLALAAGDAAGAVTHFDQALRLRPNDPEVHNSLGNARRALGQLPQAVDAYEQSLRIRPDFALVLSNLGAALVDVKRVDEGLALLRRAIALQPNAPQTWCNLGRAYDLSGQPPEALACLHEAMRLEPNEVAPRMTLGVMLQARHQLDDALAVFQGVLRLRPTGPEPRQTVGQIYQQQGLLDLAETAYQQVLAESEFGPARYHLGTLWLSQGRFDEGWQACEWRWFTQVEPRKFEQPEWDGSPLAGRTILVHPEQGLGDMLQFIRYVPLLQQAGARVVVAVQPPLVPLVRRSLSAEVFTFNTDLPPFDVHALAMSLPRIMGTRLETIPANVPYLQTDPELVEMWAGRLEGVQGFRVGINWQGNPEYLQDAARSIPLAEFEPLAQVSGVALISLQQKSGLEQLPAARRRFTIHDLGDDVDASRGALVDTAAVMKNLDLVVTSDTATAHLAGALGVKVWLALSSSPDWRWLRQREDSPWYPTMRLFRQESWNEWSTVFAQIAREVARAAASARGN